MRSWKVVNDHFPVAAAALAGFSFLAMVMVLRGFGNGAGWVEWPLVALILAGPCRPVAARVVMAMPLAVMLPWVEGLPPGVYLWALASALAVAALVPSRVAVEENDPVVWAVYALRLATGWVAARVFLGGGWEVASAVLLALVITGIALLCRAGVTLLAPMLQSRPPATLVARRSWN